MPRKPKKKAKKKKGKPSKASNEEARNEPQREAQRVDRQALFGRRLNPHIITVVREASYQD